jgi:uncharacterized protein (DUF2236 family)
VVSEPALYGPDTLTWRLNRESVLLLGGPRALLLQIAYPAVAAGVAEHSDFASDAFGRLRRTLAAMTIISFSPPDRADRELAALAAVHERVRGTLDDGTPYSALDPAAQWWVLATLIDTALAVEARYLGRLSSSDRARYYDESRRISHAFAIPDEIRPPTYDAFRGYMDQMAASLVVSDTARTLATGILHPRVAFIPGAAWDLVEMVTVDLLPRPLREQYGLAWGPRRKRALHASQLAVRAVLPRLPTLVRTFPDFANAKAKVG